MAPPTLSVMVEMACSPAVFHPASDFIGRTTTV